MLTDARTALYSKKILNLTQMDTGFLQFLWEKSQDQGKAFVVNDTNGALFAPVVLINPGVGQISVSGKMYGPDGTGHLVAADSAVVAHQPFITAIPFEDTVAVPYFFAAKWAEVPATVEQNPRVADTYHYGQMTEIVGDGPYDPDVVTNPGPGLKLVVNTATENGAVADHAGQTCYVYLDTPENGVYATAVEECVIQNDGADNYVITAGTLGQSVVSVVAADYTVVVKGMVWSTVTYVGVADYIFLGEVTGSGGGVPVIDVSGQQVLYGSGLALMNVLEVGPNGDLKIAVKAHAADVATPQVSVIDNAAVRQWHVNELGNHVWTGASSLSEAEAELVLTGSPGGGFGKVELTNVPMHLNDSDMIAAGYANGAALGGETNFTTFNGNRTSWMGNIREQQSIGDALNFAGLATNPILSFAGVNVSYTAFQVVSDGGYEYIAGSSVTKAWGVTQTWHVYYDRTANAVDASQAPGDFDPDNGDILLCMVTSDGAGNVNALWNADALINWFERRVPITVGTSNGAAFPTVYNAINFQRAVRILGKDLSWNWTILVVDDTDEANQWPLDQYCEGLRIEGTGRKRSFRTVNWTSSVGSLARFSTTQDISISNLDFTVDGAATPAVYPYSIFEFETATVTSSIHIHDCRAISNGVHTFAHAFYMDAGSLNHLYVERFNAQTTDGFVEFNNSVALYKVHFDDCTYDQQGVAIGVATSGYNIDVCSELYVRGCRIQAGADGVLMGSCTNVWIENSTIYSCGGNGIVGHVAAPSTDVNIVGVVFDSNTTLDVRGEGNNWKVIRCFAASGNGKGIYFASGTGATAEHNVFQGLGANLSGIETAIPYTKMLHNVLSGTGAAADFALHFAAGATNGLCEGNAVTDWTTGNVVYVDAAADGAIIKNNTLNTSDATAYAIYSNGTSTLVEGNRIEDCNYGIWLGATYSSAVNNQIDAGTGATDAAIYLSAAGLRAIGNSIEDGKYGIYVGGDRCVVSDNTTFLSKYGVYVAVASDSTAVNGNSIDSYGSGAGNEDGIYVAGDFTTLTGNTLPSMAAGAGSSINIAATANKTSICGNTAQDGTAMVDGGTNTLPAPIANFNTW
jgi:hypothetical protein